MTLVVARVYNDQIAFVADTQLTEHSVPLPLSKGTIKICILPGNICAGFSGSPELAERSFAQYMDQYPDGANFAETINFFENQGRLTGNDFIVAFGAAPKIIKIADGRRISSISKTIWIGDQQAYEKFREIESRKAKRQNRGRAIDILLYGDEVEGSKASDLHSVMRELVRDSSIKTVGGFVTTVSSRGPGFRFSIYSDTLFDWPDGYDESYELDPNDKVSLRAITDENQDYCVTQISPTFMDANYVGYYFLKGRKLFFFYGINNGLATNCIVISDLAPADVSAAITRSMGFDLDWLVWIISSYGDSATSTSYGDVPDSYGTRMQLFCHANTCPKERALGGLLRVKKPPN